MIADDLMPQNICDGCLSDLYKIYVFKKQCHDNFQALQSLCNNTKSRKEIENIEGEADTLMIKVEDSESENFKEKEECDDSSTLSSSGNNHSEIELMYNESNKDDTCEPAKPLNRKGFGCGTCRSFFKTRKEVREHKKAKRHAEFSSIICELCGESFIRQKKALHMQIHHEKVTFKCDICQREFNLRNNLLRHKMRHTGEKPFACSQCGKRFIQKVTMQAHEKTHTIKNVNYKEECEFCQRVFYTRAFFERHMRTHMKTWQPAVPQLKNYTCQFCSAKFLHPGSLRQHYKMHKEPQFLCNECGKACMTKSLLDSHMRTHTGEKPYVCKICLKSFTNRSVLEVHRLVHTGERPFKCQYCPRAFRQFPHLKLHERTHTGEKPYMCHVCCKSFSFKGNLIVHIRLHTGERPYKCNICGKGFAHLSAMKHHRSTHQNNTNNKIVNIGTVDNGL